MKPILVTSALPYANGMLHLGHMLEAVQADIWARYQRLVGRRCHYICADDAHGSAIVLKAKERGETPEAMVERMRVAHLRDFGGFSIQFSNYHSTHSEENQALCVALYQQCLQGGSIVERDIEQPYDAEAGMFLADRYVVGDCPECGASEQYGDNCEVCGAAYGAHALRRPRSALTGAPVETRRSRHRFFVVSRFAGVLDAWLDSAQVQPAVRNKLREWQEAGLQDWDISRDAEYFGFLMPGSDQQYFYVWFDAPIGYMASFQALCAREDGLDFDAYWRADSDAELHHFIGKDIINFHGLFWPALLSATGHRLPSALHAHGFLTVNAAKMSKSRGTFITARDYLAHLDAEYLRYYFAAKLGAGVDDIDLNWDDFLTRVNSDLVGKVVNIASRAAGFLHRGFEGRLPERDDDPALVAEFVERAEAIAARYEALEYGQAMRAITALADRANQYLSARQPWNLAKRAANAPEVQAVCGTAMALFALLMLFLKPVTPALVERAEALLGVELRWESRARLLAPGSVIAPFKPLLLRVRPEQIDAMAPAPIGGADGAAA